MIEIGNEPNAYPMDNKYIWDWCFHLGKAIERCRQVFPQARLISPGLMMDPKANPALFLAIAHDAQNVMSQCNYIGIHVYDYVTFKPAAKGELRDAIALHMQFFPDKEWYITEYGISDPQTPANVKGRRYAGLIHFKDSNPPLPKNVVGAVYYHLNLKRDIHPEYHIYPDGDAAYQQRIASAPAGGVLGEPEPTPTIPPFIPAPPAGVLGEPASAPANPFSAPLTAMIATLAEQARDATTRRAQASAGVGELFTAADEIELRRIQAFQASLEAALSCAGDNSSEAQAFIEVAARQALVWRERQNAPQ